MPGRKSIVGGKSGLKAGNACHQKHDCRQPQDRFTHTHFPSSFFWVVSSLISSIFGQKRCSQSTCHLRVVRYQNASTQFFFKQGAHARIVGHAEGGILFIAWMWLVIEEGKGNRTSSSFIRRGRRLWKTTGCPSPWPLARSSRSGWTVWVESEPVRYVPVFRPDAERNTPGLRSLQLSGKAEILIHTCSPAEVFESRRPNQNIRFLRRCQFDNINCYDFKNRKFL